MFFLNCSQENFSDKQSDQTKEVYVKNFFFYVVFIFSMYEANCYSAVWETKNNWNNEWEKKYESWIKKNLTQDIFTRKSGILHGISTDCADALYAVRISFAYENALPFVINAPDVIKEKMKTFSNETNMFDQIKNERERVRAFINYVSTEVGTENLKDDTFPVAVKNIKAGSLYHVKWSLWGKFYQHSYIIKGFDEQNELLYYASDAPSKVRKLQIDTPYPRFSFDSSPYGFRSWKWPEELLIPTKDIPRSRGYSNEQYELAERFGKKNVLKVIRKIYQNISH
jgi:hypothetical protein